MNREPCIVWVRFSHSTLTKMIRNLHITAQTSNMFPCQTSAFILKRKKKKRHQHLQGAAGRKRHGKVSFCFPLERKGDSGRGSRREWSDDGGGRDSKREGADQEQHGRVWTSRQGWQVGTWVTPWNVSQCQHHPWSEVPRLELASCFGSLMLQMITNTGLAKSFIWVFPQHCTENPCSLANPIALWASLHCYLLRRFNCPVSLSSWAD